MQIVVQINDDILSSCDLHLLNLYSMQVSFDVFLKANKHLFLMHDQLTGPYTHFALSGLSR